jgi:hypothetical protein
MNKKEEVITRKRTLAYTKLGTTFFFRFLFSADLKNSNGVSVAGL